MSTDGIGHGERLICKHLASVACVGIDFYPAFGPLFRQLLPSDSNPLLQALSCHFPKTDKAQCLVVLSPRLTKFSV